MSANNQDDVEAGTDPETVRIDSDLLRKFIESFNDLQDRIAEDSELPSPLPSTQEQFDKLPAPESIDEDDDILVEKDTILVLALDLKSYLKPIRGSEHSGLAFIVKQNFDDIGREVKDTL